jgi:hypothetical protein
MKHILKIRGIVIEYPDGSTFGVGDLEPITAGWVVPIEGWQNLEGEFGMAQALSEAVKTTKHVSVFKDGDLELWDVVAVFNDEGQATKAGKENGQMAIYQIETGRLKWLK